MYNNIQRTILDIERPLVDQLLAAADTALQKGVEVQIPLRLIAADLLIQLLILLMQGSPPSLSSFCHTGADMEKYPNQ